MLTRTEDISKKVNNSGGISEHSYKCFKSNYLLPRFFIQFSLKEIAQPHQLLPNSKLPKSVSMKTGLT